MLLEEQNVDDNRNSVTLKSANLTTCDRRQYLEFLKLFEVPSLYNWMGSIFVLLGREN